MERLFTSDLHMGHRNVVKYCDRPFKSVEHMNESLIRNIQSRVKPDDILFHLGDFCCKGPERGVPGCKTKAEAWEKLIDRRIVHIRGNHDSNNSVKWGLNHATIEFANKVWLMIHIPPRELVDLPCECDAVLCGHVHEKWHTKMVGDIPVINVGVDVNRFMPLRMQDVEELYWKTRKGLM